MKRLRIIVIGGLVLGISMLLVQHIFHLTTEQLWIVYFLVAEKILVLAVIFNLVYNRIYTRKLNTILALYQEGRYTAFMEQMLDLQKRAKGTFIQNYITVNLSAGYCKLKQYDRAIEILENLQNLKRYPNLQLVKWINLCISYFYTEQNEKAMELYRSQREKYAEHEENSMYAPNLAILDVFALLQEEDKEQAQAKLEEIREKWKEHDYEEDLLYLQRKIDE